MSKLPFVSVIIPTFNSQRMIEDVINSILNQEYKNGKVEIIIVDGGSTDMTLKLLKKFKVKIIHANKKYQNVEYNKSVGITYSRGDLLLFVDHDNLLVSKYILKKMVQPFIDNPILVGVETTHYHYSKKYSLLDRYIALFGVTDPIAFYLGKADRMPYFIKSYSKKYHPKNKRGYVVVDFTEDNLPTIGANGFMIRKSLLLKAKISKKDYFHIDVNMDLVRKGYSTYAFIDDAIAHIGGNLGIISFLKRRLFFMKQFSLSNSSANSKRRYFLYRPKDTLKLAVIILICVTFLVPLIDSIRGFIKIRDKAWFLHPIMCYGFVVVYGYAVIQKKISLLISK